jgi:hypothetical protein
MQDPQEDFIGSLYGGAKASPQTEDDFIGSLYGNPTNKVGENDNILGRTLSSAFAAGGDISSNAFTGLGKTAEAISGMFGKKPYESVFTSTGKYFEELANKHKAALATSPADTKTEKFAQFIGESIPKVAVGFGVAKVAGTLLNPMATKLFGETAANIAALASRSKAVQAGVGAALTTIPSEVVGGVAGQALVDPSQLTTGKGLATTAGLSLFGSAINGILAGRTMSKEIATKLEEAISTDAPAEIVVDLQNQVFNSTVAAARKSMRSMRFAYSAAQRALPEDIRPSAQVTKSINAVDRSLKAIEVDGVTVKTLTRFEIAQKSAVENLEAYYAANNLTSKQAMPFAGVMADIEGIKLPEYNFAAATPSVTAMQRIKDNYEESNMQQLMMDPNAPLGTAESMIASTRPESPSIYSGMRSFFKNMVDQYQDFKNPLKAFGSTEGPASNPINIAKRLSGTNGRVYQNLEIQPMLPDGAGGWKVAEVDGRRVLSMNDVLKISGTDDVSIAQLNGYVVAKQVADGTGHIKGFTPEWGLAEMERIAKVNPVIKQAAQAFFDRTKALAEYMRPAFGDDVINAWIAKDYAPMSRAVADKGKRFGFLEARKGGDQMVYSPVAQHIDNLGIAIAATERTKLWQTIYKGLEANKNLFESGGSAKIVKVDEEAYKRILKNVKEENPEMGDVVAQKVANLLSGISPDKKNNAVTFLMDGKLRSIQFSKDFDAMFEGFQGPSEFGSIGKFMQKVENIPRTAFSIVNDLTGVGPLRDLAETYINDPNLKNGQLIRLFKDYFRGLNEVKNEGPAFQQVLASGGGIGGRYVSPSSGMYETSVDFVTRKAAGEKLTWLKQLEKMSSDLSQASRMGAALRAMEAGGDSDEMAKMFRSVIADPQQVGSKMMAATRITAFMNMGVQSMAKTVEQFKNNPSLVAIKGAAGISIPAAILWYYGKDDPEIQNLRNSKGGEQYFYWRPVDDVPVLRFPKPYMYGQIFGTSVESLLDAMSKTNPEAADNLVKGFLGQATVNVVPLSLQMLAEGVTKNKFLGFGEGSTSLGGATSNQMPEDQRFQNTTTTARKIADVTGVSAALIDDAMRTFMTTEPFRAYSWIDRKVSGRTTGTVEDVPLFGKFMATTKKANIGSINSMYAKANEYADVLKSYEDAASKGDEERIKKIWGSSKGELEQSIAFAEGLKTVQEIRSTINLINENTLLTPDERRTQIDKMFVTLDQYCKRFNTAWESRPKK